MIKTPIVFNTCGDGYWSRQARAVTVTHVELCANELRVHFDPLTWNTGDHGLIYTDSLFLKQLRNALTQQGFPGHDVDYSEQGMQDNTYVSLDVGSAFSKAARGYLSK